MNAEDKERKVVKGNPNDPPLDISMGLGSGEGGGSGGGESGSGGGRHIE